MNYSKYFKDVKHLDTIDIYRVLDLFGVVDHALGHAVKKLLLAGPRTGGKSFEDDVREARDTLNRWLEMQEESNVQRPRVVEKFIDINCPGYVFLLHSDGSIAKVAES